MKIKIIVLMALGVMLSIESLAQCLLGRKDNLIYTEEEQFYTNGVNLRFSITLLYNITSKEYDISLIVTHDSKMEVNLNYLGFTLNNQDQGYWLKVFDKKKVVTEDAMKTIVLFVISSDSEDFKAITTKALDNIIVSINGKIIVSRPVNVTLLSNMKKCIEESL